MRDLSNLTNASLTTQQITGGQFVSGKFLDTDNPPAVAQTITKNNRTEYEWSMEDTTLEFTPDKNYIFRITDNGTPFDNYIQCPVINFSKIGQSAGGQPTEIRFFGTAYPDAKVTIYAKDANTQFPIKREEIESSDGTFKTNYTGILQNAYNYSLIITDKDNRNSQVKSYNLDVYANSLNVKSIFVSPTLGLLRNIVTKGDFITVAGYATPNNSVEFEVDNRLISGKTSAGGNGHYKWLFNTAGLNFGEHRVRAMQIGGFNAKSDWSPTVIFTVSRLLNPKTDLNNDGIINISDWSVFLSSWNSENESVKKRVDLNGDGKTNISDFSIFLKTLKSSGKF